MWTVLTDVAELVDWEEAIAYRRLVSLPPQEGWQYFVPGCLLPLEGSLLVDATCDGPHEALGLLGGPDIP